MSSRRMKQSESPRDDEFADLLAAYDMVRVQANPASRTCVICPSTWQIDSKKL